MTTISDFYSTVQTNSIKPQQSKKNVAFIVDSCLSGKNLFNYAGSIMPCVPADVLRLVSQTKSLHDDDLVRSALINSVLSCERRCSGSGFIFLAMIGGLVDLNPQRKRRITATELRKVISFYAGHGKIGKIVERIVHENAFNYEIEFIDSASISDVDLYSDNLLSIRGHIDPIFSTKKLHGNFFIVQTTGKIETIGEIDPLLQWAQHENKKVLLLAKCFSPDVATTLEVNYGKKLNVVPFIYDDEDYSMDALCPVVRQETGIRFSNLDFDSFDAFDTVIKNSTVLIKTGHGKDKIVKILVPQRHNKIKNIIVERIKAGISITKNALLFGVDQITIGDLEVHVPSNCVDFALNAKNSFENVLKTSCVVTLEQKNVYQNYHHA